MNCTAIRAEDGRRITLPQPVGLELKCTCSSPARQATLTFGIETPLPLLAQLQIEQYARRTPLFSGAIDEQVFSCGQSSPRVMLSARSLGGALLDYEALPASYNQPDLQAIFLLHAAPYGLSSVRGEGRCPGVYQVGKGQSEWEVLTDFCAYVCGWQPRVTKDGILEACPPGQDACHLFSNEQYGGIRYSSLKRIHRPYGVIHEVRYRPDRESGYAYAMQQPEPSTATARRFLNLAQSPAWRGRREAELLLQRSLSGSEELVLEAPFSFAGELGDAASAPDGLCAPVRKDWCIWSLCYHWRPSDIGCTVTLRPKTHF